ncbi:AraC family transcriptional regulator [Variovorax sp. 770b2]|uniref:AraC family transcriptional regulator n=1 Tax=Variovorax sp. 770b2 TaxID=1566271 RepID=UPI0008DFCF6E|nr:AraC family transcriptional regulator [Variovorax sp. 770b2]SFP83064.1 AraC-type DNA-binding protein [Variovorax sp. 770b2]
MDPLSDVLSMLTVSSTLSSRFEARGRWALRYSQYASHIKLGCVLEGRFRLDVDGAAAPVVLEAGDFFLLTNGLPFSASSDPPGPLRDGTQLNRDHRGPDGVVRYDGQGAEDGTRVALASGRFALAGEAGELLLRHLPPLIHLRASDPGARPLVGLLDLLGWETAEMRPGSSIARTNLAALVLVQALRVHLANAPQPEGWLGAMADARIGAALSQMHADIAQPWTVERLAQSAGMSRTAFAVRFKALTGSTPLDYLGGWRMTVARNALRHGEEGIARIAERVGYQSETAFSAAFKRETGESPGRFRTQARATGLGLAIAA